MTLTDICKFIVDCPHSTAEDEGVGLPLIRTPNIGKGRFVLEGVHRVCESVYNQRCARAVPQGGDIIFAREAPAGNAAIIKDGQKMCLGQRTVLIRPDVDKVIPEYLVYYLLAPEQQYKLLGTANGATVAHVNLPTIREMNVDNLPSRPVQRRIADILSAYDDLIENNRKQIKLLEEAAQRLYKEWFIDLRFPGHEHTPIINGIPDGWDADLLGDLIDFNPAVARTTNSLKQFVPMEAISASSMLIDYKNTSLTDKNSGSKFEVGDTLLARITPCLENGKTAFVSKIHRGEYGVGSTEFIVMRYKKLTPYMVYLIARTDRFRTYAINSMTGSDGRQRAKVDKLELYPILRPSQKIIDLFSQNAEPIFSEVGALSEKIFSLQEARDRLLPKLMNGELSLL